MRLLCVFRIAISLVCLNHNTQRHCEKLRSIRSTRGLCFSMRLYYQLKKRLKICRMTKILIIRLVSYLRRKLQKLWVFNHFLKLKYKKYKWISVNVGSKQDRLWLLKENRLRWFILLKKGKLAVLCNNKLKMEELKTFILRCCNDVRLLDQMRFYWC